MSMDASLARAPNTQLYARQKAAAMAANARRVQLRLDCGDDGFGNVVLDREHVGKLAMERSAQIWLPVTTSLSWAVMRTRSGA